MDNIIYLGSFQGSNASSICDLGGPFVNASRGGGWGESATGDAFYGQDSAGNSIIGGGVTYGGGVGSTGFTGVTTTNIIAF